MKKLPESVILNRKGYKVLTPNGYENFLGVNKIVKDSYIHLKFSNGRELKCSLNHPIMTDEGLILASDINKYVPIKAIDGDCFVVSKRLIRKKVELYDIVDSGSDHLYYTNGIVSHNCNFLGSSNTLIEGAKLQSLYAKDAIDEVHSMEVFEYPIKEEYDEEAQKIKNKDHFYVICVDVSQGKNLDYSAFSVFDCSSIPYKQVATYKSNTISPLLLPDVIKLAAVYYNNAYVLIEINNNPQVADCLLIDLEYEYVFKIFTGNKLRQVLSESSKANQNGLNMSPLVKRTGCTTLKTLIETNKLELMSADTIYELTTFVINKGSFAAEEGSNDDLVMTLVSFAWLTTQKMFIEMAASDIRKTLQIENNYAKADEDLYDYPADPVITSGLEKDFIIMGGDVWEEVGSNYENYW